MSDGHAHAGEARARGAVLVVGEEEELPGVEPYLSVSDARRALALLSCAHHSHPSREMRIAGTTGTNGKTSVTWMNASVFREAGLRSGLLGTLGSGADPEDAGSFKSAVHTTPEAPELQAALAAWRAQGVEAAAMEVSSHGLALRRSYGTRFHTVVFTNLSVDHLDFHRTMDRYAAAKSLLFRREERGIDEPPAIAVVNDDDPATDRILAGSSDTVLRFGHTPRAQVQAREIRMNPDGILLTVGWRALHLVPGAEALPAGTAEVNSTLLGSFQADNLLASFAVGLSYGIPPAVVASGLGRLRAVPGRMERVDCGQPFRVLVDYAHTPDALERALASLRPFTPGRLLLVFGCGGNRDQTKRAPMGEVAARGADWIVLTDDNPRNEDPSAIRAQVRMGIEAAGGTCLEEGDRRSAVRRALRQAGVGDTVLVAGKGHETTMERAGTRIPYDDRAVIRECLEGGSA
jgi:UDP-N-acetylmuramoyl-L-alanyl-D-glutamate--2,6-diaminopimelate ligase